jgi:arylsulfatase A-like enzyme
MTGLMPSTTGAYSNAEGDWENMDQDALGNPVTLPRHFMDNGYHVMGRGKLFHRLFDEETNGMGNFHEYYRYRHWKYRCWPENMPANGLPESESRYGAFDWAGLNVRDGAMDDFVIADWGAEKLAKDYDKPFFLGCGFVRPHLPWYVPQKYFDMYPLDEIELPNVNENDLDDVPPMGREMARDKDDYDRKHDYHKEVIDHNLWREAVQGYLAAISFADACVGHLLDGLDKSKYADNTVVVLWGDHGWHLGEKLHWRKFALWEEATRTPLMMVAPSLTAPGGRCSKPASLIDIYPTLIDVCGLKAKPELDGESLRPLLENPDAQWARPALTTHGRNNHSLRSERWRYIRYRDGSEELYDHSVDELEWKNLAGDPKYANVKNKLAKWLPKSNAPGLIEK